MAEADKTRDNVKTHGNHAREVIAREVATVEEDASLAEIATILEDNRIKRVPVVRNGKLVGIVSRSNLLQGLATVNATPGPRPPEDVRAKIVTELDQLDFIHPTQMNIIVSGGVVKLWGCLGSEEQELALMVSVENVAGAAEVSDHVSVTPYYHGGV
jgi:CBS-domain-containing membrane protein